LRDAGIPVTTDSLQAWEIARSQPARSRRPGPGRIPPEAARTQTRQTAQRTGQVTALRFKRPWGGKDLRWPGFGRPEGHPTPAAGSTRARSGGLRPALSPRSDRGRLDPVSRRWEAGGGFPTVRFSGHPGA
jgi:hypothetical protein